MEPGVTVRKPDQAGPSVPIVTGAGSATAVVWPGMGARHRSLHRIDLEAGDRTRTLHHSGEAVYYIRQGAGTVHGSTVSQPLTIGAMVHVRPGHPYWFATEDGIALLGGPCPPDQSWYEEEMPNGSADSQQPAEQPSEADSQQPAEQPSEEGVRVFHRDRPSRYLPMISSDARLVVWPGVGAHDAPMNYVRLQPGEENEPHAHANSEDTIFVLDGGGTVVDLSHDVVYEFEAGDVIHVPAGIRHAVRADRGLPIESVGGPAPADPALAGTATDAPDGSTERRQRGATDQTSHP